MLTSVVVAMALVGAPARATTAFSPARSLASPTAPALTTPVVDQPSPPFSVAVQTGDGVSFSRPPGWRQRTAPCLMVFDPPEGDAHVAIVDIERAANAEAAAAAAWKIYKGGQSRSFGLLTPLPARNGWDEEAAIEYETSPSEHLAQRAVVRRKGKGWTVSILDGSESTVEKRAAQINLIVQSIRAAGYKRETFAGKTAHGLDRARVKLLLDFLRESSAELKVPGVGVALIDHGKVVYEGGVGVREAGKPELVDAHTLFMIASNTKGMSTLLLARLVDEGKINWDQPVTEVYPGFQLGNPDTTRQVLVRHLVCACTGLPRKDFEWIFAYTADTPPSTVFAQLAATAPTSRFGEVYQYNNFLAAAAGYIGAHVLYPDLDLGPAYDAAMQTKIFDPLGMHDTTFSLRKALALDHASPHGEGADGKLHVLGPDVNNDIDAFRPAGGAWSSPHDMILYVQDELTKGRLPNGVRLVSSKNLLARRAHSVAMGEDQWYGMGLMDDASSGVSVIHHGGDLSGYHSDIIAIPSAQVGAVLLTNADNGVRMRRPFIRRLLEILYDGRPEAAEDVAAVAKRIELQRLAALRRLTIPAAPAVAQDLAPIYANPDLGKLVVDKANGGLRLSAAAWSSEVASRQNDDGTVSLITVDPLIEAFDFVVGSDGGRRILTVRDGQHAYRFVETSN